MRVKRKSTPSGNWRVKVRSIRRDRQPDQQYYNRDRHGERNPSEPAPCHRGRSDHNRRGYVRWPQELTLKTSGKASQGRGSGSDIPRASFLIWSTI